MSNIDYLDLTSCQHLFISKNKCMICGITLKRSLADYKREKYTTIRTIKDE